MSEEIVFHHNPQSRAAIAHWMLEETGLPYRVSPIDFQSGQNRQPEFLKINPMGKIPTIEHRGVVVTETAAILAYLADLAPDKALAPAVGTPERGAWYRWLVFGAASFEPAVVDVMMKRDAVNKQMAGWGSFDDVLATLRGELSSRDWLVGGRFTAADLYIAAELSWTGMFGAPGVKGDPVFDAYVARCTDRDAWRRANSPT